MEQQEYASMFQVENEHWWYVSLRRNILLFSLPFLQQNKKEYTQKPKFILDAGCGTGANLEMLHRFSTAIGLDYSPEAITFCKKRGLTNLLRGSVTALPFENERFDAVYSIDVIYHRWVEDDMVALKEYNRILKQNGILVLNLPSYNFLMSTHDQAIFTARRYSKKEIKYKLQHAGFILERLTFWNTILFPLILIVRLSKKMIPYVSVTQKSDVNPVSPILNNSLKALLRLESLWLSFADLPFGLSMLCIARKSLK
jgi:SAM-dependent methyltransferase